jgi:hypothetical protein
MDKGRTAFVPANSIPCISMVTFHNGYVSSEQPLDRDPRVSGLSCLGLLSSLKDGARSLFSPTEFPVLKVRESVRNSLRLLGESDWHSPVGAKFAEIPCNFPVKQGTAIGDEFAGDCVHHHPVSHFRDFFEGALAKPRIRGSSRGSPLKSGRETSLLGEKSAGIAVRLCRAVLVSKTFCRPYARESNPPSLFGAQF